MYAGSIVDASINNIPTAYNNTAGSKVISESPSGGMISFINTTPEVLAYTVLNAPGSQTPSSTLPGRSGFIPSAPTGGAGFSVVDGIKITQGQSVFVRATSNAATSGKLYVWIK